MRYLSCYPVRLWEKYNQPIVRDLAWMFFAPSLLQKMDQPQFNITGSLSGFDQITGWLMDLDQYSPKDLQLLLDRDQYKRLGLYCESLFELIATHMPRHPVHGMTLINRNIQIFKPNTKVTLGELDFLLRDQHKAIHHVEMAIKFYLLDNTQRLPVCHAPLNTMSAAFIGPNRADRLDLKLNRLNNHQLPLAHSEITQQQLHKQQVIDRAISMPSKLLLKGQLFHYYQSTPPINSQLFIEGSSLWAHCTQHHHALTQCEIKTAHAGQSRWQVLTKLNWLAGEKASEHTLEQAHTLTDMSQQISEQASRDFTPPILLQQYIYTKGQVIKGCRLMIVQDNWPSFET